MAELIDLEEVQKSCAAVRERYIKNSEQPREQGVVSRLGADCDTALTIWRAKEANRRTDTNDVINALIIALTAHIAGEVMNSADGAVRHSAALSICTAFAQTLFDTMAAADTGDFEVENIPVREVGSA